MGAWDHLGSSGIGIIHGIIWDLGSSEINWHLEPSELALGSSVYNYCCTMSRCRGGLPLYHIRAVHGYFGGTRQYFLKSLNKAVAANHDTLEEVVATRLRQWVGIDILRSTCMPFRRRLVGRVDNFSGVLGLETAAGFQRHCAGKKPKLDCSWWAV